MPNFWGFLIGFILWGAKAAFTSGTFEAIVYDELKAMGKEDAFTKVYGRTSSVATLAMGLAALLSVAAFQFGGYQLVLAICVISNAIATLALMTIKEVPIAKSTGETRMFDLTKKGIKDILGKKELLIIVVFTALIASISTPIEEYMSLLVVDAGLAVIYLGLFAAALSLMEMLGGLIADRFEKANEKLHYFLVILSGIMMLVAALLMNEITVLLLVLEAILNPVVGVIFEGKTQKLTSSEVRATTSSIRGFLSRLGSIIIILIVGFIAQYSSYKEAFIFLSSLSLIVGITFLVYTYLKISKQRRTKGTNLKS
jgi:Na+/melibiose symporter-like transporter